MLLCIMALFSINAFAQLKVTGVVTDESDGVPIPFASIMVKGTKIGAATDANGAFVMNNVPPNAVLIFSYIGYETRVWLI